MEISQLRSGWFARKINSVLKARGNGLDIFQRPFRTKFRWRLFQPLRSWLISGCPFGTKPKWPRSKPPKRWAILKNYAPLLIHARWIPASPMLTEWLKNS